MTMRARTTSPSALARWVRWTKNRVRTQQGVEEEWQPSAACFVRDGPEVNRTTGRAGRLQIVLNEGGDPFLLRRTSYRKMFKPGQYGRDPYEPGGGTLREKMRAEIQGVAAMTGFRPKRFDVAGAHPDEAWRAVSEAADVVKEMQAAGAAAR